MLRLTISCTLCNPLNISLAVSHLCVWMIWSSSMLRDCSLSFVYPLIWRVFWPIHLYVLLAAFSLISKTGNSGLSDLQMKYLFHFETFCLLLAIFFILLQSSCCCCFLHLFIVGGYDWFTLFCAKLCISPLIWVYTGLISCFILISSLVYLGWTWFTWAHNLLENYVLFYRNSSRSLLCSHTDWQQKMVT